MVSTTTGGKEIVMSTVDKERQPGLREGVEKAPR